MASAGPYQARFIPTAPIKGSFPLDREGVCKLPMLNYMLCMQKCTQQSSQCRKQSRLYLQCRMEHDLMDKDELSALGFHDHKTASDTPNSSS
jgi:cytochrome c oxidase assembly protein subunit 19